jgi:hypothetical protein
VGEKSRLSREIGVECKGCERNLIMGDSARGLEMFSDSFTFGFTSMIVWSWSPMERVVKDGEPESCGRVLSGDVIAVVWSWSLVECSMKDGSVVCELESFGSVL